MKIPLTKRSIKEILSEWEIRYSKSNRIGRGYMDPSSYTVFINTNQSIAEIGKTLFHEILHIHYENSGIFVTELQIEMEARKYYEETDLLDFIHGFL